MFFFLSPSSLSRPPEPPRSDNLRCSPPPTSPLPLGERYLSFLGWSGQCSFFFQNSPSSNSFSTLKWGRPPFPEVHVSQFRCLLLYFFSFFFFFLFSDWLFSPTNSISCENLPRGFTSSLLLKPGPSFAPSSSCSSSFPRTFSSFVDFFFKFLFVRAQSVSHGPQSVPFQFFPTTVCRIAFFPPRREEPPPPPPLPPTPHLAEFLYRQRTTFSRW